MKSPGRFVAPVAGKAWLTSDIVSFWVESARLAGSVRPGQFVGIRPGPGPDPLLRRPISIADVSGRKLRLVFRVVGRGTGLLSRARPGDAFDLLGPLGRPAPVPGTGKVVVCGGGVGAAPLLFYVRRFRAKKRLRVMLGARSRDQLILVREFRKLGVSVDIATDDGSAGHHGPVTDLITREVKSQKPEAKGQSTPDQIGNRKSEIGNSSVVACGPRPMLARLVAGLDPIPVWGYVEERMGCGTGICYCCALPKKGGGYVRFCEEGPVVLLNEVELQGMNDEVRMTNGEVRASGQ